MDSTLRPRDIQARIRAGESPEAVAAAGQTTVEKIIGFATPVLAERAYIADQALKASVRRRTGDGQIGRLGEAVAERLRGRDIDADTVEWDSWRREDGRWTLVATFGAGQGTTRAQFVYDVQGRYVVAEDEQSRWLVGERVTQDRAAQDAGAGPVAAAGDATADDGQLPLGDDAIELVTGRRPAPGSGLESHAGPGSGSGAGQAERDEVTVDLTDTAAAIRSTPHRTGDADWMVTQASERPGEQPGADRPARRPAAAAPIPAPEPEPEPATLFDETEPAEGEASSPGAPDPQPKPRKPARGKGRASVPSWDEIMFGSPKSD